MYHSSKYMTQMNLKRASPALKCQGFYLTLDRSAKKWYNKLLLGFIRSRPQLKQAFWGIYYKQVGTSSGHTIKWFVARGKTVSKKLLHTVYCQIDGLRNHIRWEGQRRFMEWSASGNSILDRCSQPKSFFLLPIGESNPK